MNNISVTCTNLSPPQNYPKNYPYNVCFIFIFRWYSEGLSRIQTEILLQQHDNHGAFLIRKSETYSMCNVLCTFSYLMFFFLEPHFSLSVLNKINVETSVVFHYKITHDEERGQYYMFTRAQFKSLKSLVDYYSGKSL